MTKPDRHQQAPTPVRLPEELKAALKVEAGANDRSLNGEIVQRLRQSFEGRHKRKQHQQPRKGAQR